MEQFKGYDFGKLTQDDVYVLTPIMKRAFDEDSKRHLGEPEGGPPGYDNGDFIRKWFFHEHASAYKIMKDGVPIGAVNVFITPSNKNTLGCMFIDPDFQDKGVGVTTWQFIEQKYPETVKWSTETPGFSKRNHHFYVNKLGFKIVRIENPRVQYEESYVMEKEMHATCTCK